MIKHLLVGLMMVTTVPAGAFLLAAPALAVEPSEVLDDPALETRARDVGRGLRCVVCQNQSIDDSNAELARDMRVLVRKRILNGDSNQQVTDYMVDRYGDYVLLDPPFKTRTLVLWLGPVGFAVFGALGVIMFYRNRRKVTPENAPDAQPLSADEKAKFDALMKDSKA